jgi:hypothetical protein
VEERPIGLLQPGQHILKHMRVVAAYSGNAARMFFSSASC